MLFLSFSSELYTPHTPTPHPQPNGRGGDFILRYKSCLAGVLNNNNKYIFHGGGWGIPAAGASTNQSKEVRLDN
jgi:hypothetical protein